MTYQQHPLSAAFPSMGQDGLDALVADIKEHGQREPGVLFEDMVLDGWHRYQACERAGVEFVATVYTGDDPVAFVISKNAHRRHLTAGQRATAVVSCHAWRKSGENQHTSGGGDSLSPPPASNAEMAAEAKTDVRTVQRAKRAVEAGLGEAVRDGKISVQAAAEQAAPKKRAKRSSAAAKPETNLGAGASFGNAVAEPDEEGRDDSVSEVNDAIEALYRIASSDDVLAAALDTVKQQDASIRHLTAENSRLMDELAQARGQVNYWRKKAPKQ